MFLIVQAHQHWLSVLPITLHLSMIWPLALLFRLSTNNPPAQFTAPRSAQHAEIGAKYHTFLHSENNQLEI